MVVSRDQAVQDPEYDTSKTSYILSFKNIWIHEAPE